MDTTTDLMTATEMATVVKRDERSLAEALDALAEAETGYESITRRRNYSSDEGHAVGLRDHLPALVAVEQSAARVASASERNVRTILAQAATTTRMTVDAETEARAAAKVPIVARQIEVAPVTELRDQLRAAIVADDVATMYLFGSLLPARLAETPAGQATARPEVDAARAELGRLIGRVKDQLRDASLDPVRAQADAVLSKAATARRAADRRRQQDAARARVDAGEIVPWPKVS